MQSTSATKNYKKCVKLSFGNNNNKNKKRIVNANPLYTNDTKVVKN